MHRLPSSLLIPIFLVLAAHPCLLPASSARPLSWDHPVSKIAFGSCNSETLDQQIFQSIANAKPDLFIWLGDAIYADRPIWTTWCCTPRLEIMKKKYSLQRESPPYANLAKNVPIVGVWDDHDYGENNAGKSFAYKLESQQLYLDFLEEPSDSPRRKNPGVYTSYDLPGPDSDADIKIILLDVRFNKPDLFEGEDLLGEEQWRWLEQELSQSRAKIHIIGSGIQILPDNLIIQEYWNTYPSSRRRLFELFKTYKTPNVLLISGDVHHAEILKIPNTCTHIGQDVYEFTSSGLTHTCTNLLGPACKWILKHIQQTPYHIDNSHYVELNWGEIYINWDKKNVTLYIRDISGDAAYNLTYPLNQEVQTSLVHESSYDQDNSTFFICDRPARFYHQIPLKSWLQMFIVLILFILLIAFSVYLLIREKRAHPHSKNSYTNLPCSTDSTKKKQT
ncbi:uncharacterized protein LOC126320448 [Schistocerca gregaria]|uniref:uncharacterized protein LOC126320448 n=1 Tax=Schistocerca gregaria TaxID=7010 RepID=UPI00211DD8AD|nr:uncharacterized protein LOC126320448 [Schistocerca gregaria]